jgi:rubrerythrin
MVEEEGVTSKGVHSLDGGIRGWEGKTLPDYPRIQVFDKSKTFAELLFVAMDLEKGAFRFYTQVTERFGSQPFSKTFERLTTAETAHAKAVYRHWKDTTDQPPEFEALFEDLPGEILEGGGHLNDMIQQLETLEGNVCLNLIELALDIENAAFDLYRTMADRTEDPKGRDVFLDIAQAEKAHMKSLIDAIGRCH